MSLKFKKSNYDALLAIICNKAKEGDQRAKQDAIDFENNMNEVIKYFSALCKKEILHRSEELDIEPVIWAAIKLNDLAGIYGIGEIYTGTAERREIEIFCLEAGMALYSAGI